MDTKKCSKCGEVKGLDEFHSRIRKYNTNTGIKTYNYINAECIKCELERDKIATREYRKTSKYKDQYKKYRSTEQYKERNRITTAQWKSENKDKYLLYNIRRKKKYIPHPKIIQTEEQKMIKRKEYYYNNRDVILAKKKIYSFKIKDRQSAINKIYRENNQDKINEGMRKWYKKQRNNKTDYYVRELIRDRIRKFIKYNQGIKEQKTTDMIGCSYSEIIKYLNNLDYDRYAHDLDHIIPLSAFNIKNSNHKKVMFHYTNIQPLDPYLNRIVKKDNLPNGWKNKVKNISDIVNVNPIPIIKYIEEQRSKPIYIK